MKTQENTTRTRTLTRWAATVCTAALLASPLAARAQDQTRGPDGGQEVQTVPESQRYAFNNIVFDFKLNGYKLPDRAAIEAEIRKQLEADPGSRYLGRQAASQARLEVLIETRRRFPSRVQVSVRLGLTAGSKGKAFVTATESETVRDTDRIVDATAVYEAFRKARQEFGERVTERARSRR